MEIQLAGTEISVLRETLESIIVDMERKLVGLGDPEAGEELEKRKDVLRAIREKLPAGLTEAG